MLRCILINICLGLSLTTFGQNEINLSERVFSVAKELEMSHPSEFYIKSGEFYTEKKTSDAGFLFYLGQLRYRYYINAAPNIKEDEDKALFASLQNLVGGELNFKLFEDTDNIIKIIDEVITWDAKNDFIFFTKNNDFKKHQEILDGLKDLRKMILENKDKTKKERRR